MILYHPTKHLKGIYYEQRYRIDSAIGKRNMLLALYGILFDIEEALKNKQGIENSYIKTRL